MWADVATLPNAPKMRPTNGREAALCRIRSVCDGYGYDIKLRRIVADGATRPMMCCGACAVGRLAR
jgi:hypothetical protein